MFRYIIYEAQLIWRLMLDSRIPVWKKLIPLAALIYVFSPLDFIPDFLIGLGQLDDLGILIGGLQLFKSMVPEYILREHLEILEGQVIDVQDYHVLDDDE